MFSISTLSNYYAICKVIGQTTFAGYSWKIVKAYIEITFCYLQKWYENTIYGIIFMKYSIIYKI